MYNRGDFHLHTNASDGKLSPKELIHEASLNGLDIIAITDHDTTLNVEEGIREGLIENIRVIPGIELSTIYNNESIHILGYFKDDKYKDVAFQNFLKDIDDFRILRAKKIVENLDTFFKIKLDYQKVLDEAKGVIARPHIAKAIIDAGYKYDWKYIFDNFLSNSSPAYVHIKRISTADGITILKKVNALVVLAHPVLIKKSTIDEMLSLDFDGIEAVYPINTKKQKSLLKSKAKEYGKLITAGSDFHGITTSDTSHGVVGSVSLSHNELATFVNALES
ncbi:PHP domain-containing protein [Clostridium sp. CM028]|uniref:PHP domain-containing protein n=1 Tax=unclassified Clostridium TaxID=2614128 RepID=UPI001C0E092B|nr:MULTISPECIES: PHP domain-containing protein [unclassified Clostridium]MBU3090626.1 PHP domain-containing protein [Clostridium sp. CF011]MBW9144375.1 PHP domain-containing protein [Clostridium sp. CM027]MBW9149388.1 PHP domain-containing protein [Clostridium sp. CM028]UVE40996.1 PHP domain-containing protein [Clostridium sp. CM027]WAG69978.1 PHP domain-containing protein [Clostridium sp. CF011]